MIFVTLSLILKNFSLGQVGMPKFNVLVLLSLYTHVIANRLDLKYVRCCAVVNASGQGHRWHPVRVSPDPQLSNPGC